MIFADKLIALRKKAGWSQEELAQQLNVSRQSVSKWEGAQSVPDLDKIVQLSRIFGVSTDYLLKDELEAQETAEPEPEQPVRRRVSMEEASQYLGLRKQAAPWLALATFLCVLSPITLILLAGLSGYTARISENVAGGIGLCVLILLVAAAVGIFLMCGAKAKPFSFLETEPFETEYGVSGMVRQRRQEFERTANRLNLIGSGYPGRQRGYLVAEVADIIGDRRLIHHCRKFGHDLLYCRIIVLLGVVLVGLGIVHILNSVDKLRQQCLGYVLLRNIRKSELSVRDRRNDLAKVKTSIRLRQFAAKHFELLITCRGFLLRYRVVLRHLSGSCVRTADRIVRAACARSIRSI